jgi:hypothetical protein
MSNELGDSGVILCCPSDDREPVTSISNLTANVNISYFVGVISNASRPEYLLGGDRNLGPGSTADEEYGYSPTNGRGADVVVKNPVTWSKKMHSRGRPDGFGNILLGDGSAQQVSSTSLRDNGMKSALQSQIADSSSSNAPGLRLIFP